MPQAPGCKAKHLRRVRAWGWRLDARGGSAAWLECWASLTPKSDSLKRVKADLAYLLPQNSVQHIYEEWNIHFNIYDTNRKHITISSKRAKTSKRIWNSLADNNVRGTLVFLIHQHPRGQTSSKLKLVRVQSFP